MYQKKAFESIVRGMDGVWYENEEYTGKEGIIQVVGPEHLIYQVDYYYGEAKWNKLTQVEDSYYTGKVIEVGSTVKFLTPYDDYSDETGASYEGPEVGQKYTVKSITMDVDIEMVTLEEIAGEYEMHCFEDIDNPIGEVRISDDVKNLILTKDESGNLTKQSSDFLELIDEVEDLDWDVYEGAAEPTLQVIGSSYAVNKARVLYNQYF